MLSYLLFSAFLFAMSAALMWLHLRAWRAAQSEEVDERAADFRRRQFRRRMQASAMIGIVGVAVVISVFIADPIQTAVLWCIVLALVAWMLLLAFSDMVSSMFYYKQLRAEYTQEHASLQAQLDRVRQREGNGQAHD